MKRLKFILLVVLTFLFFPIIVALGISYGLCRIVQWPFKPLVGKSPARMIAFAILVIGSAAVFTSITIEEPALQIGLMLLLVGGILSLVEFITNPQELPEDYTVRNVFNHKITSSLTILGVVLVVFVFSAVLMFADGLFKTLVTTGADDNAVVIRKASQSEVTSIISREQADIISTFPEIAADAEGVPEFTREMFAIISLPKRNEEGTSNITVRGVTDKSLSLRPDITIQEGGRMFKPGTAEVIAGKAVGSRFKGAQIGETVRFNAREWTIVGIFDAGGTAFDSEIWGDIAQMQDAFRRGSYISSMTMKLKDPSQISAMQSKIEGDPRLPLEVKPEKDYYAAQSEATTTFIKIVGIAICIIFSFGAIVGAMITMYSAVANRTKEIGTLRALGFSRFAILVAFLFEAVLISLLGGAIGLIAATFLKFVQISTVNFNTFTELAFNFSLTSGTITAALIFALIMGFVGGFLPAVRASRLKIVDSLRAG